jgi:hypothetical protein
MHRDRVSTAPDRWGDIAVARNHLVVLGADYTTNAGKEVLSPPAAPYVIDTLTAVRRIIGVAYDRAK